jgi:hypothetical protein
MSEQPNTEPTIEPVADDDLQEATGGQSGAIPSADNIAASGPENDIGATSC